MPIEIKANAVNSRSQTPLRTFVLSQQQGGAWIRFLADVKHSGHTSTVLSTLYDSLVDACWLARWSRNYVTLDIPLCEIPAIIDDLARITEHSLGNPQHDIVEEIIRCLSAG